jgi:integrase
MSANQFPPVSEVLTRLAAERLEVVNASAKLGKMPLREGAMLWLQSRKPFIGARTARDYERSICMIVKFVGNVRLEKLANPDLIRAYQLERSKTCGSSIVNHECSIIQQLLKRIRKWNDVSPFYEPLPLPRNSPGKAMTPDEEKRLFEAGALNPGWAGAYWLAMLSMNTAAGPGELVGLQLRDLSVENPETARIFIRKDVKNKYRVREVPVNSDALAAVNALLALAKSRGAVQPDHYLVPFRCKRDSYDPTRHGYWPKTSWLEMCAAAGIKLRPYDLRHHALTKLAEKNPEQVVLKIAGHVSPQMLRKIYAHVRLDALRGAVDSISSATRAHPAKKATDHGETPEQTLLRVAQTADQLGIRADKALQLLVEYERQQSLKRNGGKPK